MKYRAVLFDLGSTLIEYENSDWASLGKQGVIEAYPILKNAFPDMPPVDQFGPTFYLYLKEILDNERVDHSEFNLYELCRKIFARMNLISRDGLIEKFVHTYYQPIARQITLEEGAPEILKAIKDAGLKIGLVSNTIFPEKYHLDEMAQFGLLKYFDFTIFSCAVKTRKPGLKIFKMALDMAETDPGQTVFIGDRYDADIIGAKNAGMTTVWKYHDKRENPDNIKPDYSIIKLNELYTIIFS
ncbi:MAG: HAD family hydrolase [candidate division Zixibacteria bacterium]|nr:HAD family hydrolase [candidate division Zixibacteria bacterium]